MERRELLKVILAAPFMPSVALEACQVSEITVQTATYSDLLNLMISETLEKYHDSIVENIFRPNPISSPRAYQRELRRLPG